LNNFLSFYRKENPFVELLINIHSNHALESSDAISQLNQLLEFIHKDLVNAKCKPTTLTQLNRFYNTVNEVREFAKNYHYRKDTTFHMLQLCNQNPWKPKEWAVGSWHESGYPDEPYDVVYDDADYDPNAKKEEEEDYGPYVPLTYRYSK